MTRLPPPRKRTWKEPRKGTLDTRLEYFPRTLASFVVFLPSLERLPRPPSPAIFFGSQLSRQFPRRVPQLRVTNESPRGLRIDDPLGLDSGRGNRFVNQVYNLIFFRGKEELEKKELWCVNVIFTLFCYFYIWCNLSSSWRGEKEEE